MNAGGEVNDSSPAIQAELLRRVAEGDQTALSVLLAQGRTKLVAYLRFKVPQDLQGHLSAEDVVQEAHTAVFRRREAFVPGGADSFDRWVRAVAARQLRDAIRRQRTAKRGGGYLTVGSGQSIEDSAVAFLDMLGAPVSTPSRCVAQKEAVGALRSAMKGLPEQYRQALWLVHIEGQPLRDVAAEMGRTERAVSGLCRRGLRLLQLQLQSASRFLSSSG